MNSEFKEKIEDIKKQLKDNPARIFGLVYPYIFVAGIIIGILYIKNLNEVERTKLPPRMPDTTSTKEIKLIEPKFVPAIDLAAYVNPSKNILDKGKNLFNANCSSCHGVNGDGKGVASTGMIPPPRNFTSTENWKNGFKISQIYKTLEEGIPGSAMISFNFLTPSDRLAIIQYINKSFFTNKVELNESEIDELNNKYKLKDGVNIAGQIPVDAAIQILAEESQSQIELLKSVLEKLDNSDKQGKNVFLKVTSDKATALKILTTNLQWKKDQTLFENIIVNNINQNGFNGSVFSLSKDEWKDLFNFLNTII